MKIMSQCNTLRYLGSSISVFSAPDIEWRRAVFQWAWFRWLKWSESAFDKMSPRVVFQKHTPHWVSLWALGQGWEVKLAVHTIGDLLESSMEWLLLICCKSTHLQAPARSPVVPSIFMSILPFREWCEMRNTADLPEGSWRETCPFTSVSQIPVDLCSHFAEHR